MDFSESTKEDLYFDNAIKEAELRGIKKGLEEAALVCERNIGEWWGVREMSFGDACSSLAEDIRSVNPTQVLQK